MADLQRRKLRLEAEITAKTARLLDKQLQALEQQARELKIPLQKIREVTEVEKKSLRLMRTRLANYDSKQQLFKASLKSLEQQVDVLSIDKESLTLKQKALKKEVLTSENKLNLIKDDISRLLLDKTILEDNVVELQLQKVDLERKTEILETSLVSLNGQITALQGEFDSKIKIKQIELEELIAYEKKTRTDLAQRELNLNEREQVITIRERKADMQEETIQHNAGLLEL